MKLVLEIDKFVLILSKNAKKQIRTIEKDKKVLHKLFAIFSELEVNPYSTTHKFEHLRHNLSGYCSKRLDHKNRVVYSVQDDIVTVEIVSILGHYED